MTAPLLSVYSSGTRSGRESGAMPIHSIVSAIRRGERGLRVATERARELLSRGDKSAYDALKPRAFAGVTFAGRFTGRRNNNALTEHSGFVALDFDYLTDARGLKEIVSSVASTLLTFTSPSGAGVKVIVRVTPTPRAGNHRHAWAEVARRYRAVTGLASDDKVKDPARLTFLAYDPAAVYRPDAEAVQWHTPTAPAVLASARPPASPSAPGQSEDAEQALLSIPRGAFEFEGTYYQFQAVVFSAFAASVPYGAARAWNESAGPSIRGRNFEAMWRSLEASPPHSIGPGTLFHIAQRYRAV